jgi:hypothetical protein
LVYKQSDNHDPKVKKKPKNLGFEPCFRTEKTVKAKPKQRFGFGFRFSDFSLERGHYNCKKG